MTRSGIVVSYSRITISFLRIFHTGLQSCTILQSHQEWMGVPLSLDFLAGFLFVVFFIFALLTGLRWSLNSAQICISQMTSAKRHFYKMFLSHFSLIVSVFFKEYSLWGPDQFWVEYLFSESVFWIIFMFCGHLSSVTCRDGKYSYLFCGLSLHPTNCFLIFANTFQFSEVPVSQLLNSFTANTFVYTGPILDIAYLTGDMDENLAYRIVPFLPELWSLDRILQLGKPWHPLVLTGDVIRVQEIVPKLISHT